MLTPILQSVCACVHKNFGLVCRLSLNLPMLKASPISYIYNSFPFKKTWDIHIPILYMYIHIVMLKTKVLVS